MNKDGILTCIRLVGLLVLFGIYGFIAIFLENSIDVLILMCIGEGGLPEWMYLSLLLLLFILKLSIIVLVIYWVKHARLRRWSISFVAALGFISGSALSACLFAIGLIGILFAW